MTNARFDPVPARFCGVQFLPIARLERIVVEKLDRFERSSGERADLPIDIEYLIEIMEDIEVNYFEERDDFGSDVLGAYDFTQDKLFVRQKIEPEGRRRFTLAHEYGHYVLHKPHFLQQIFDFFAAEDNGAVQLHRGPGGTRNKLEWQANAFAGHILMPTGLVEQHFGQRRARMAPNELVKDLADISQVSLLAADIRLKELGWI